MKIPTTIFCPAEIVYSTWFVVFIVSLCRHIKIFLFLFFWDPHNSYYFLTIFQILFRLLEFLAFEILSEIQSELKFQQEPISENF